MAAGGPRSRRAGGEARRPWERKGRGRRAVGAGSAPGSPAGRSWRGGSGLRGRSQWRRGGREALVPGPGAGSGEGVAKPGAGLWGRPLPFRPAGPGPAGGPRSPSRCGGGGGKQWQAPAPQAASLVYFYSPVLFYFISWVCFMAFYLLARGPTISGKRGPPPRSSAGRGALLAERPGKCVTARHGLARLGPARPCAAIPLPEQKSGSWDGRGPPRPPGALLSPVSRAQAGGFNRH